MAQSLATALLLTTGAIALMVMGDLMLLITMLTGPDLLARVKELGDASKSDLVRECGAYQERSPLGVLLSALR